MSCPSAPSRETANICMSSSRTTYGWPVELECQEVGIGIQVVQEGSGPRELAGRQRGAGRI